jgi:uncharacterized protein
MARREANPLRVNVAELRRRPGERTELRRSVDPGEIVLGEVSATLGESVELDLVLESIQGGIAVTGTISVPWSGPCRRCLDPTSGRVEAEVVEVFADDHVDGETYPIRHDSIDLRQLVIDATLLALPLAPLCRPDCPGPAPEGFPVHVEDDDEVVDVRPRDPRWDALDALREQFEGPDLEDRDSSPPEERE